MSIFFMDFHEKSENWISLSVLTSHLYHLTFNSFRLLKAYYFLARLKDFQPEP